MVHVGSRAARLSHAWLLRRGFFEATILPGGGLKTSENRIRGAGADEPPRGNFGHRCGLYTHGTVGPRLHTHTHTHTHIRSQTRPHTLIKVRNSPAKPIRLHSAAVRFWRFFGRTECNNKTKQKQNRNKTETKPKQNKNTITTKQNDAECRYKRRAASAEHRPPVHRVTQRWRPSMHALSSLSLTLFSQPKLVFVLLLSFELDGLRARALFPYSISIDVSI